MLSMSNCASVKERLSSLRTPLAPRVQRYRRAAFSFQARTQKCPIHFAAYACLRVTAGRHHGGVTCLLGFTWGLYSSTKSLFIAAQNLAEARLYGMS